MAEKTEKTVPKARERKVSPTTLLKNLVRFQDAEGIEDTATLAVTKGLLKDRIVDEALGESEKATERAAKARKEAHVG